MCNENSELFKQDTDTFLPIAVATDETWVPQFHTNYVSRNMLERYVHCVLHKECVITLKLMSQ
jgi:hypothetical protein